MPEGLVQSSIEGLATAKYIHVSPQKARLVIDQIRGHRAADALQLLQFTKKRVAREISKVLHSAIANAEHKADEAGESLDVDTLWVTRCFVNEGPRAKRLRTAPMGRAFRYQKRIRPAPMGRAYRYQRRTSHIAVVVSDKAGATVATEENA